MDYLNNLNVIVSGIIFIIYLMIKFIKLLITIKKNKQLKKEQLVDNKVLLFIQEAETLFENGLIKKEFVLESINEYLKDNNIKIDLNTIESKIEEIINLSKTINYKGDSNE